MPRVKPHHASQKILQSLVITVFIATIGLVILGYTRSKKDPAAPLKSMDSPQQADAPLGYPLPETDRKAPFDLRFIQLTAFERALIPTATRMAFPMGSAQGALTYNAQSYWDDNPGRGGRHTGDDLNGIGGMNTDLGDPVYAIANGMVVYRGEPSPSWGNTLILAHRTAEGNILLSMYSHLDKSYAPYGRLVHMGEIIGTVGTAHDHYPAHLHLEMRDSTGIYIGPGYTSNPGESRSPSETINRYKSTAPHGLFPSALAMVMRQEHERQREKMFLTR
ncbi:MAG: M23 family metallopeptidase [Akkermansiaceae bacterium]